MAVCGFQSISPGLGWLPTGDTAPKAFGAQRQERSVGFRRIMSPWGFGAKMGRIGGNMLKHGHRTKTGFRRLSSDNQPVKVQPRKFSGKIEAASQRKYLIRRLTSAFVGCRGAWVIDGAPCWFEAVRSFRWAGCPTAQASSPCYPELSSVAFRRIMSLN
jgi:hypothetical protein